MNEKRGTENFGKIVVAVERGLKIRNNMSYRCHISRDKIMTGLDKSWNEITPALDKA